MVIARIWMVTGLFVLICLQSGCSAFGSESERIPTASAPSNGGAVPDYLSTDGSGSGASVSFTALDDILMQELQAFRSTQGLSTLTRDPQLDEAAQALVNVMARKNDLSHRADGQRAGDRIAAAGYVVCTYGSPWAENIARSSSFGTAADVAETIMTGWINSPNHRRNMAGRFAEVGLAVALTGDDSRIYAAQVFATPGPGPCL